MTTTTTQSHLVTTDRMSNTGYHANGKPLWWARVGPGSSATFLRFNELASALHDALVQNKKLHYDKRLALFLSHDSDGDGVWVVGCDDDTNGLYHAADDALIALHGYYERTNVRS